MTKEITITAPEGANIEGLQIEQIINQPADLEVGPVKVGDADISLNEAMIIAGYAWAYDGGTKQKNFEELREIRREFGTLDNG